MHQNSEGALTPAVHYRCLPFSHMLPGIEARPPIRLGGIAGLGERAPAPLVRICFFDDRLSRSTCQVGYVQYIHTFTHGPLWTPPWLPRAHQTAWESQSDTNYAEGVGELLANTTLRWLAVTPAHLICSLGLRAAARVSVGACKWITIG